MGMDTNLSQSIPLLLETKNEYANQLISFLKKPLYEGIKSIYDESVEICKRNNENKMILKTFQDLLSRIPQWNQLIIDDECNRIIETSSCNWLDDLITAVFVSHTRVLSITNDKSNKKINLSIPTFDNFIHKVYIFIARQIWKEHLYI